MTFVYSNWYIVMAVLIVAIVALIVTFILMDKKDRVLINEFVKSMQANSNDSTEKPAEVPAKVINEELKEDNEETNNE